MPRLLIVSSTFWPHPVVGSVRMAAWARHLPAHGWTVDVLTQSHGPEATLESLREAGLNDVRVHYVGPRGAARALTPVRRARLWARNRFLSHGPLVPDTSLPDWRALRSDALATARAIRPDVVLSTSPAHAVHDLGGWLAEQLGVPWVADFRDPYLIDARYAPRGLGAAFWPRHRAFEASVYARAALVTHAVPIQARWARRAYPAARDRIAVIENGVPEALVDLVRARDGRPSTRGAEPRRVSVVGGGADAPLFEALSAAVGACGGAEERVKLRLVGAVPPGSVARLPWVDIVGRVPHTQALAEVASADVLVAPLSVERSKVLGLSSKLFEYLAAGRPVVVLNPTVSDRLFLSGYAGVRMLGRKTGRPATPSAVAAAVRDALAVDAAALQSQSAGVAERYGRSRQAAVLARHVESLL